MEVLDPEEDEDLYDLDQDAGTEVINPTVSLNALHGDSQSPMMRMMGWLGKQRIFVLIDTGSTHNFINQKLCQGEMHRFQSAHPVNITVADGGVIPSSGWYEGVSWQMQGHTFAADVIAIPLTSCDLILGMQWLRQWGTINWDFANLVMEFTMGNEKVRLQATKDKSNKVVNDAKLHHIIVEDKFCFLLQVLPCFTEAVCCSLEAGELQGTDILAGEEDVEIEKHKNAILDEYRDVFEEPTQLPPFR